MGAFFLAAEFHTNYSGTAFKVERVLYQEKSDYQDILVFETKDHGKVLMLGGAVMLTERDEFCYHEMLVHPVAQVVENLKKVLVIGGGDGGTVKRLLAYSDEIEKIDVVEIDDKVVEVCKRFFPELASSFNDRRVNIVAQDGMNYIATTSEKYDLIICDTTDPVGPAEVLYSRTFYEAIKKALNEGGIAVSQSESPFYHAETLGDLWHNAIKPVFSNAKLYLAFVPTYCNGLWSFAVMSESIDVEAAPLKRREKLTDCRYYNEEVHRAAFKLPEFVKKIVKDMPVYY